LSPLLTADDVAAILQVPRTWVYRAAREGLLPSVPCGRYVRFHRDDIDAWINAHRAGTIAGQDKAAPASVGALNRGLATEG
jgi:excisionase family DNA binding protein